MEDYQQALNDIDLGTVVYNSLCGEFYTNLPMRYVSLLAQLMSKLLFDFANNFEDLEQLCEIDLTRKADHQLLREILGKSLGFKLRAHSPPCAQVVNSLQVTQAEELSSLVELASYNDPSEFFEYEFCSLVSTIIYSMIVWTFKDSENNISMFDYLFVKPIECFALATKSVITTARYKPKRPDLVCFLNGFLLFKGKNHNLFSYLYLLNDLF